MKILLLNLALLCCHNTEALKVDTALGGLQGKVEKAVPSGQNYAAFTSVPYAQPPVGNLRFKSPQMVSKWEGVLDATEVSPMCPQLGLDPQTLKQNPDDVQGQEDCLYLNVYVPLDSEGNW